MTISSYKKELLYRKAQGNKIRDAHTQKISEIVSRADGKTVRIGLTETDTFLQKVKSLSWTHTQSKVLNSFPECLVFLEVQ